MLSLAGTLARSRVNGPGERFVIWVQGCSLRCPGCWNPQTWSREGGRRVTVASLVAEIVATPGIEGITFSGGEPFEQAGALAEIAVGVREQGFSVMAYTGHELSELVAPAQRRLLSLCDIVVSGRYVKALRTLDLLWRGSSNQRLHVLSDRYDATSLMDEGGCEVYLGPDGTMTVTGFPPDGLMVELRNTNAPRPEPRGV